MVCRNGYRRGGSTKINDPKSTPASDASTPNATQNIGGDDHPPLHKASEWRRTHGSDGRAVRALGNYRWQAAARL
jgi:hypothetical protein